MFSRNLIDRCCDSQRFKELKKGDCLLMVFFPFLNHYCFFCSRISSNFKSWIDIEFQISHLRKNLDFFWNLVWHSHKFLTKTWHSSIFLKEKKMESKIPHLLSSFMQTHDLSENGRRRSMEMQMKKRNAFQFQPFGRTSFYSINFCNVTRLSLSFFSSITYSERLTHFCKNNCFIAFQFGFKLCWFLRTELLHFFKHKIFAPRNKNHQNFLISNFLNLFFLTNFFLFQHFSVSHSSP